VIGVPGPTGENPQWRVSMPAPGATEATPGPDDCRPP
jgi:hypothetical protein